MTSSGEVIVVAALTDASRNPLFGLPLLYCWTNAIAESSFFMTDDMSNFFSPGIGATAAKCGA